MDTPVRYGIRVLTAEQLKKLPDHNFSIYRHKVLGARRRAKFVIEEWCCAPKSPQCDLVDTRTPTREEAACIQHFEQLSKLCRSERDRRLKEKQK